MSSSTEELTKMKAKLSKYNKYPDPFFPTFGFSFAIYISILKKNLISYTLCK